MGLIPKMIRGGKTDTSCFKKRQPSLLFLSAALTEIKTKRVTYHIENIYGVCLGRLYLETIRELYPNGILHFL